MGVVEAKIQAVEEIYQLVWAAVANRRPIAASYHGLPRLFCPHRLGRNKEGELRVLCYQYGGESESGLQPAGSPANGRCITLEKLRRVKLLDDCHSRKCYPYVRLPVREFARTFVNRSRDLVRLGFNYEWTARMLLIFNTD